MSDTRLELADEPTGERGNGGMVPPPLPPADPEAWYASDTEEGTQSLRTDCENSVSIE